MLHDTGSDVSPKPHSQLGLAPLTLSTDGVELGLVGTGLVLLPIMVFTYKRINARREGIMKAAGESGGLQYTDEELRRMGDKSPNFNYGI
jgi:hypothetical protein